MNNEAPIFQVYEYYEFINLDRKGIKYSNSCKALPIEINQNEEKIKKIFDVILALIAINPEWTILLLSKALGIKQTAINYFFGINKEILMKNDYRKKFHEKNKNMEIKKDGHTLLVEDFYKDLSIPEQIISSVSRSSDYIDTEVKLDDDIGIKVEKFYKNLSIQEALITSSIEERAAQTPLSSSSNVIDIEAELDDDVNRMTWLSRDPNDNSFYLPSTREPTQSIMPATILTSDSSPIEEVAAQTQLTSSSDDINTDAELDDDVVDKMTWLSHHPDANTSTFSEPTHKCDPSNKNYYLSEIQEIPLDNVSYNGINFYRIDRLDNTVDPQSLTRIHTEFLPPVTSFPDYPKSKSLKSSSFKKGR